MRKLTTSNDISFKEMYDSLHEKADHASVAKMINKALMEAERKISKFRGKTTSRDIGWLLDNVKTSLTKLIDESEDIFQMANAGLLERGPADRKFKTDKVKGHSHLGTTDEDGNGKTIKTTGSGKDHVHKVTDGEIQPASGHIHKLEAMESVSLMESKKRIPLKAAIVGTKNGKDLQAPYRAVIWQEKGKWLFGIEQSFDGKFTKYSGLPGWHLTDLLDHGDFIYIDMGQQWGARGITGAVKEALKHI